MTGRYHRPEDLLREFRAPVMLVDDPEHAERLRRRTVANLQGLQARSVVRRQIVRSWRKRFLVAALILFPTGALAATWSVFRVPSREHSSEGRVESRLVARRTPAPAPAAGSDENPAAPAVNGAEAVPEVRKESLVAGSDVLTHARAARRVVPRAVTRESSALAFDDVAAGAASRSTLAAENALMQAAMGAVRSGDDTRAVALFADFLSRYPRSPLAQNAEVERFLARHYLGAHPNGMAEEEARRVGAPISPPAPSARP